MEFASGNVQLITTKESWDQKLEQARGDGKIVIFTAYLICSIKILNFIWRPIAILLCCLVESYYFAMFYFY